MRSKFLDFLPSRSAFLFPNCFPSVPVTRIPIPWFGSIPIGDASGGLCGGMVYAVRDCFEQGVPPPKSQSPPDPDSKLFQYLTTRLIESFDLPWGVARYFEWMQFPDQPSFVSRSIFQRTREDQWPLIQDDLDSGSLATLGLVTVRSILPTNLKYNHQVLAYGYEVQDDQSISIAIYDPNHPSDDTIRLVMRPDDHDNGTITHTGGMVVRGFFETRYTAKEIRDIFTE